VRDRDVFPQATHDDLFTLGVVVARVQKRRRMKLYMLAVAAILVFLVGFTRVYLGGPLANGRSRRMVRWNGLGGGVLACCDLATKSRAWASLLGLTSPGLSRLPVSAGAWKSAPQLRVFEDHGIVTR
jgi:hypothetical protein